MSSASCVPGNSHTVWNDGQIKTRQKNASSPTHHLGHATSNAQVSSRLHNVDAVHIHAGRCLCGAACREGGLCAGRVDECAGEGLQHKRRRGKAIHLCTRASARFPRVTIGAGGHVTKTATRGCRGWHRGCGRGGGCGGCRGCGSRRCGGWQWRRCWGGGRRQPGLASAIDCITQSKTHIIEGGRAATAKVTLACMLKAQSSWRCSMLQLRRHVET
jgi:hypothetical protein